jgi:hypothetical protein
METYEITNDEFVSIIAECENNKYDTLVSICEKQHIRWRDIDHLECGIEKKYIKIIDRNGIRNLKLKVV